ncbi:hypothetical protein ASC97_26960 [Rhizobium sp. Root1203]|uniref:hypothetical protein n=1 Tax=Rhizobium sp. Root1203 TaxID=1736427 RepID=UPI000708B44F|nr:hypothetical protein [Rhizobium sp. Root1203]KQV23645.1 hypothetical protein ASC97_26960 [Rhizobium sp. Root1203]
MRNESPRKTYRTRSRLAFAGAAFALVGTALLASCASQVMKNYVGGPGYVKETECFYTFYARAAGTRWIVTNFRKPKLECE